MKYWRPAYYSLMSFWLIAGLASGQRIFFVLFASQALLALNALVMDIWAAYTFRFLQTLSASKTIHGQPVKLELHIYNENILPYPLMKIRLATAVLNEQRDLQFNLSAGSQIDFDLILECPYRGDYQVGMTIIDFVDIFNLVRLPFDMRKLPYYRSPDLLVYPMLHRFDRLPLPALERKSFSRRNFATEENSEPFSTIRSYRPGDASKQIHWKASSRQQTLLTRQYDQSAEPRVLLVLDFQKPPWTNEAAWQAEDVLCENAAGLIHHLLRQDKTLSLVSLGVASPFADEREHYGMKNFQRFYKWLAAVPFVEPGEEFQAKSGRQAMFLSRQLAILAADVTDNRALLVLTTQVDLALVPALIQLRRRNRPVMIIVAGPGPAQVAMTEDQLQVARQAAELQRQLDELQLPSWFASFGESRNSG